MRVKKGNFRLSRVQGGREIVSTFVGWDRAYLSYRLATVQGWDYVELVRVSDGCIMYHDGCKPEWLDDARRAPGRSGRGC